MITKLNKDKIDKIKRTKPVKSMLKSSMKTEKSMPKLTKSY